MQVDKVATVAAPSRVGGPAETYRSTMSKETLHDWGHLKCDELSLRLKLAQTPPGTHILKQCPCGRRFQS